MKRFERMGREIDIFFRVYWFPILLGLLLALYAVALHFTLFSLYFERQERLRIAGDQFAEECLKDYPKYQCRAMWVDYRETVR